MKRRSFLQALALSPLAPHLTRLAEILPAPVARVTGLTALVARTIIARDAQIAENISSHNALLAKLREGKL